MKNDVLKKFADDTKNYQSRVKSDLASIHTESSNQFTIAQRKDSWVGLTVAESKFTWVNGEPLDFEKWSSEGKVLLQIFALRPFFDQHYLFFK